MSKEYLDKLGLERVAEYVNNKVAKVLTLPSDATEGLVVLYVGGTSATAIQGHIYKAQEGSWVDITPPANTFNDEDFSVDAANEVSLLPARRVYHGTRAAWNLLSVAEKTQYGATAFTDDEGGTSISSPVLLTAKSVPGLTLTWRNDHEDAHQAFRVGDVVYVNLFLDVTGTYTGTSGNVELFDMPKALLENGESFIAPYYINNGWDTANNKPYQLRYLNQTYFENGYSYNLNFQGQIILLITRS